MDLYGAGRVMENIGEAEKSVHFFKRALEEGLSDELSLTAKKKISYYFKKSHDYILIGILENVAAGYIDPLVGGGIKEIFPYIILVIVLLFRPHGLFGLKRIERI